MMNANEQHCNECDKPIVAKGKCVGHYQQARRHSQRKPLRAYGTGYNRVAGAVNDVRYAKLQRQAEARYGGSMYRLVQEVLSEYADSLDDP